MSEESEERFVLTAQHIELLRAMHVSWISFRGCPVHKGAPRIDTKRPYGNSFVLGDLAELLGFDFSFDEETEEPNFEPEAEAALWRLHRETEIALQVVLATGRFEPGTYCTPRHTRKWRLADQQNRG